MLSHLIVAAALAASPVPTADLLDSVVMVWQGNGACAGAVVSPDGLVATAYHCIASGGRPRVVTRDGRRYAAQVLRVDVATDLAVLEVPDLAGEPWLVVRPFTARIGESVRVLGHPYGSVAPSGFLEGTLRWSAGAGIVSAVGVRSFQLTAPVNPGNSGGPVVDEHGQIIGVVSRRLNGDGLGFAGRSDRLRALVVRNRRSFPPFGGTLALEAFVGAYGSPGTLVWGVAGEAAVRDRVFVSIGVGIAPTARWDAVAHGDTVWPRSEYRIGIRQRLFHGPWAVRLDGYGGAGMVRELRFRKNAVRLDATDDVVAMVGAAVEVHGVAIDVARYLPDEGTRVMVVAALPFVRVF